MQANQKVARSTGPSLANTLADVAKPLPGLVFARWLGVPQEQSPSFWYWNAKVGDLMLGAAQDAQEYRTSIQSLVNLVNYLDDLVRQRRAERGSGVSGDRGGHSRSGPVPGARPVLGWSRQQRAPRVRARRALLHRGGAGKTGRPERAKGAGAELSGTRAQCGPPREKRVGQSFSLLGDGFRYIAFSWITLRLTHSTLTSGYVLTLQAIPRALLTLVGAALSDRRSTWPTC